MPILPALHGCWPIYGCVGLPFQNELNPASPGSFVESTYSLQNNKFLLDEIRLVLD